MEQRFCVPAAWWTEAYAARRTRGNVPTALTLQSKPPIAQAGLLPFQSLVAEGLYGQSPAFWDAMEARGGVTAFGAIPAETRGWRQRPRTEDKTYTYKGAVHAKRVVVTPTNAPRSVAAWAGSLPAASW